MLAEKVQGKPITVVLDNASIHKAKDIKPLVELLKTKGLTLYFLPAFSPELNRIERLWDKMALLHKAAFFPKPYSGATIVRLMLSKVLS